MTLSTISEQGSWSAHVFYAWMPDADALVFTTDPETRHGREMLANPSVSAGIVLETKVVGRIKGAQLTGKTERLLDDKTVSPSHQPTVLQSQSLTVLKSSSRNAYLKRFPYAIAAKLDLWVLYIDTAKFTDNRLGFGKKVLWERPY